MLEKIKSLYNILDNKEKKNFIYVSIIQVLKSFIELISLGSLYPLIYFIFEGDLNFIKKYLNIEFDQNISLFLFIILFIFSIFSLKALLFILFTIKENRFLIEVSRAIKIKLYNIYLDQGYEFFLNKKSEIILNNVMSESNYFSKNQLAPLYNIFNEVLKIILILVALIVVNPKYIFIGAVVFLPLILFYVFWVKKKLIEYGLQRKESTERLIDLVNKGISSIREIIIFNNKLVFIDKFKNFCTNLYNVHYKNNLIHYIPKILLEYFIVVYILFLFFISIVLKKDNLNEVLIFISFLSLSFVRILPAINNFIKCYQDFNFFHTSTLVLKEAFDSRIPEKIDPETQDNTIKFENINFDNVSYNFKDKKIFENISFEINLNYKYGIVGDSGSGKTTLINLILGFLNPDTGSIKINNQKIQNIKSIWQKNISYIPQDLYLMEDSILNNITLGLGKVDKLKINNAIKISKLDEMIEKYPEKIEHKIKNTGLDISGGQKQRIGIARSIYFNRGVTIFDEVTNALDEKTEIEVLKNLINEFKNKPFLIVSHSNNINKFVDKIIEIKNKKIYIKDA